MEDDLVIRTLAHLASRTFQTSALLIKFLTLRVIDVVCFILNVLALCTVVRIPAIYYCLHRKLISSGNSTKWIDLWQFLGLLQIGIFIVDLPFMIMALPLIVFFWRAALLLREHGPIVFEREGSQHRSINPWGYTGWRLRQLVWKHFCLLITDFFFIPFSFVLTLSWRSSRFRRLLQEHYASGNELRWKKMIVKEFLILLNEIICFPMIFLLLISWRNRRVRRKVAVEFSGNRNSSLNHLSDVQVLFSITQNDSLWKTFFCEWYIVISESLNFALDMTTLPALSVLLLSWRSLLTWQIFKPWYTENLVFGNEDATHTFNNEKVTRVKIWQQFLNLAVDALYIPPMALVSFSWRTVPFLKSILAIYSMQTVPQQAYNELSLTRQLNSLQEQILSVKFQKTREKVMHHFFGLITDVICIMMFLAIFMASFIFPWRIFYVVSTVWRKFSDKSITEAAVKTCIFEEFLLVIRDIPTTVAGLTIALTVWRVPFLLSEWIRIWFNDRSTVRKGNLLTSIIFEQFTLLLLDILTAPFVLFTILTVWRLKPYMKDIRDSKGSMEEHNWQWFLVSYSGHHIRKAAVIHSFTLVFVDLPCLVLILLNIVIPLRLPAIASSLLNCSNFHQEYPLVVVTESINLLIDLSYIALGSILFFFRPIAVVVNLLEDERHRKARELREIISTVQHLLRKSQKCSDDLDDMVNILVKASLAVDGNMCKFLLSKVVVDYSAEIEQLKVELMSKYVDDNFIYLISKYLFLFDKQGYMMYRRFLIEKFHLKRPSYYARLQNLDMFTAEYSAFKEQLTKTESEILHYAVDRPPLWSDSAGFFLRSRKENHKIIVKTLTTGYFATISIVLLNILLVYRSVPLLLQIFYEPYMIRSKAKKNLSQYWLDLKCLLQILAVVISVYRCPDLVSDLIVDIFYKRSVTAIRRTVAAYPPRVKDDILNCLSIFFRWSTVAYLISSVLFFCFIPLSALMNAGKNFTSNQTKVIGGISIVYVFIVFIPVGIIYDKADNFLIPQHQIFEYLSGVLCALALILSVLAKKPQHLPPVDFVRFNWGLIHVIIHETFQLGQILALLFRLPLVADPSRWYHHFFKTFVFDSNDPKLNLTILNTYFYCWFFISSAPIILEGILKYVPEGRFSNSNFSWQFSLSLLGSVTFVAVPYLGSSYLCSKTEEGNLIWQSTPGEAIWCMTFMIWYLLTSIFFYCRYFNSANPLFDLHYNPIYNSIINIIKLGVIFCTVFLDIGVMTKIGIILVSVGLMIVVTVCFPRLIGYISSLENQQCCNSGLLKGWRLSILVSTVIILLLSLVTEMFPSISSGIMDISMPMVLLLMVIIMSKKSLRHTSQSVNEEHRSAFMTICKEIEVSMREKKRSSSKWNKIRKSWLNLLSVVRLANEMEKQAEQASEDLFQEQDSSELSELETAPPTYDQVGGDNDLPSYHTVNTFEPPPNFRTEKDFIPDLEYLTSPIGTWQPYSASHLVRELSYLGGYCDLTQTITDQKCTGSNILLILERHIHYTALSRSCVQRLTVWRAIVEKSDWHGLVKYATMLKRALTFQYDEPTGVGIVQDLIDDDFLKPLADDSFFPQFVQRESLFEIKLRVHRQGRDTLLSLLPQEISNVFARLISENYPMIHKITETGSEDLQIKCELFKDTKISIVSVSGAGFKMAAGASIELPKTVFFDEITENSVVFRPPYPVASKSFLSANIPMMKTFVDDDGVRIGIGECRGKTVEMDKAIQTLTDLSWK